jgi:hypothetical protein
LVQEYYERLFAYFINILIIAKEKRKKKLQNKDFLTPKGPRVFLLKIAPKQPLLKASQIVQN